MRHAQAFQLDLPFRRVVAPHERVDRLGGAAHDVFQAVEKGLQESLDRFRLLGGEFWVDDDGIAVKLQSVIRHRHEHDVIDGTPRSLRST